MIHKIQSILKNILINNVYQSVGTKKLNKKVVIVTGDTGAIGSAIVKVLLTEGAYVIGASENHDNLQSSKANYLKVKTDITKEDSVLDLITLVTEKYGKIDAIVNNAGMFSFGDLENISEKEFDRVLGVNLKGVFLMCKHASPVMKRQKSGTIINIGSKISHNTKVEPKKSLYALTKYAIEGFSYALNRELRGYGVRVICLMPGTVKTFVSRKMNTFLSPFDVGEVVNTILKLENVDFEGLVFKSLNQDI
jgi:NAD(P)-dependent dehydrogenase (short-subunit alcohol dehydrogenase family)